MKRKGRPLLVATAGLAFVSYVSCERYDKPVGNLRPVDLHPDAAIEPVGNLKPPEPVDAGTPQPQDAGSAPLATEDSGPPIPPVGNLRPPPTSTKTPHPVGNLKPPPHP